MLSHREASQRHSSELTTLETLLPHADFLMYSLMLTVWARDATVRKSSHELINPGQHQCYRLHHKRTTAVSGLSDQAFAAQLILVADWLRQEVEAQQSTARFPSAPMLTIDGI